MGFQQTAGDLWAADKSLEDHVAVGFHLKSQQI